MRFEEFQEEVIINSDLKFTGGLNDGTAAIPRPRLARRIDEVVGGTNRQSLAEFSVATAVSIQQKFGDSFLDKVYLKSICWFLFNRPVVRGKLLLIGNYPPQLVVLAGSLGWSVYIIEQSVIPQRGEVPVGCIASSAEVVIASLDNLPFRANSIDHICLFGVALNRRSRTQLASIFSESGSIWCWDESFWKSLTAHLCLGRKCWSGGAKTSFKSVRIVYSSPGFCYANMLTVRTSRTQTIRHRYRQLSDRFKRARGLQFDGGVSSENKSSYFQEIARALGYSGSCSITLQTGNPDSAIIVLVDGLNRCLVRIPLTQLALKRARRNFHALRIANRLDVVNGLVPKPLRSGVIHQLPYFAEEFCEGIATDEYSLEIECVVAEALLLIKKSYRLNAFAANSYQEEVALKLGDIANSLYPFLDKQSKGNVEKLLVVVEKIFIENKIPMVPFHGDLKVENLLLKNYKINKIIDWDLAEKKYFPLLDFIHLLTWVEVSKNGKEVTQAFTDCWLEDGKNRLLLISELRALVLDETLLYPLLLVYWLHHLTARLDNQSKCQSDFWLRHGAPVILPISVKLNEACGSLVADK